MLPYEALYGRPYRSPIGWTEVEENSITGPGLIRDTLEKVSFIRQRLLTAHSLQKSYVDVRRRPLGFEVGDHFSLKVNPERGVVRFGKRGKLSPRFIWASRDTREDRHCAYRLALPPSMSSVLEVFHVSMLLIYILQIQLMWWIGDRLRLTLMGPLRRDQGALFVAVIRFCDARP